MSPEQRNAKLEAEHAAQFAVAAQLDRAARLMALSARQVPAPQEAPAPAPPAVELDADVAELIRRNQRWLSGVTAA